MESSRNPELTLDLKTAAEKEDAHEIERITNKIYKTLQQDKEKKSSDVFPLNEGSIQIITSVLQNFSSFQICKNVVGILYLCIKTTPYRRLRSKLLETKGVVQELLAALVHHRDQLTSNNQLMFQLHSLIIKFAKKDKQASLKARLSGAAKITANLVILPKLRQPLHCRILSCLKLFLSSGVTASHLGKEGLVENLHLNLCHFQNDASFKSNRLMALTLETLCLLLKIRTNVKRLLHCNGMVIIFSILENWYKSENKAGKRICKSCLFIISLLAEHRIGCRAITDAEGIKKLHKISMLLPPGFEYDMYLADILAVILKCKQRIPLSTPSSSAVSFELPANFHKPANVQENIASDDDFSEESIVSDDDECVDCSSQLIQDLSLNDGSEQQESQHHFSQFFSERPCHPSSMIGYPCCAARHSNRRRQSESKQSKSSEVDRNLSIQNVSHENKLYEGRFKAAACQTKNVTPFVKLAYPDMNENSNFTKMQTLLKKDEDIYRKRVLFELDQIFEPQETKNKVVYDLDALLKSSKPHGSALSNNDELRLGKDPGSNGSLIFESRFECGNLRKAVEVNDGVFNLILNPDINANGRHQWFYFEVYGMEAGVPYVFNIIDCEKPHSQFNFGMQPLFYSVKEATDGNAGWKRIGSQICYYKNRYMKYTTTFTIKFPHSCDICYLAYHFPYSYTTLQVHLKEWNKVADKNETIYFAKQKLCDSLAQNAMDVVTITGSANVGLAIQERRYVFLTARVHPGETNASWTLKGTVELLLSDNPIAIRLREHFIFKIIPMLNPDGVINGNHRCSLLGVDLNRCWSNPSRQFHPLIYHVKQLFHHLKTNLHQSPMFFCDYHGHSRKKNVFLFGCSSHRSWYPPDRKINDKCAEKFGQICEKVCKAFSYSTCRFAIEKSRESTARVTVWRNFSCCLSYTLESTYCGFNQGPYKDFHISPLMMEEMGSQFCTAISSLLSVDASSYIDNIELDSEISEMTSQSESRKHCESNSSQSEEDSGSDSSSEDQYEKSL